VETRPDKRGAKRRVRFRYRNKVTGSATRPRVAVFRSLKHIYVQAIDDEGGVTLASVSSLDKEFRGENLRGSNVAGAKRIGELIGERLVAKGLQTAVFDRGGNRYHGRVRAVADGAREKGLKI
jgi:large subunit ribosomal protein L18